MTTSSPITAKNTIGEWLEHPKGRHALEQMLAAAGLKTEVLQPALGIPLGSLVAVSHGQVTEEAVTALVLGANDGVIPEEAPGLDCGKRFVDRLVIVTGAASGIGEATARRIVNEGGHVVAADLSGERLEKLAASLPEGTVSPVAGDITTDQGVAAIMEAVSGRRIDGLANVAGVMDGMMPLHEVSNELWDLVMNVNVTGTFKVSRAVIPVMLEQGEGAIVNVASQAALRGNAAGTAYGTSKHAIVGMTKSEAFLYGPEGLRINAVAPGGVATAIDGAFRSKFAEARIRPFLPLIPPISTAEQQAAAITWLLSADSSNLNGVIMPTDGGWSVQ